MTSRVGDPDCARNVQYQEKRERQAEQRGWEF